MAMKYTCKSCDRTFSVVSGDYKCECGAPAFALMPERRNVDCPIVNKCDRLGRGIGGSTIDIVFRRARLGSHIAGRSLKTLFGSAGSRYNFGGDGVYVAIECDSGSEHYAGIEHHSING